MPAFGVPGDARARAVIKAAFPDREIVQIVIAHLASGGGGIHCITQPQPGDCIKGGGETAPDSCRLTPTTATETASRP